MLILVVQVINSRFLTIFMLKLTLQLLFSNEYIPVFYNIFNTTHAIRSHKTSFTKGNF